MQSSKIKLIFPIIDKNILMAHLNSFEWDFTHFGDVYLFINEEKILMKCIACGNVKGDPVLQLQSKDPKYLNVSSIADLVKESNSNIWVSQINSDSS